MTRQVYGPFIARACTEHLLAHASLDPSVTQHIHLTPEKLLQVKRERGMVEEASGQLHLERKIEIALFVVLTSWYN
jgi:hypothetical protein